MTSNTCLIHGDFDAGYAVCRICAGAGSGGYTPTQGPGTAVDGADTITALPTRSGPRRTTAGDDVTQLPRSPGQQGVERTQLNAPQKTGMLGWLVVKTSPHMRRGHIWKLEPNTVYGRGNKADQPIEDPKVSDLHARIRLEESVWMITDLDSSNGTCVNGKKVETKTTLCENDEIQIGDTIFVLKVLA